jgi:hypothetical protein
MAHASETVVVGRSMAEVFAFLEDGTNNVKWRPGVISTAFASGPANRAIWIQTNRTPGGRTVKSDYRISWYEVPTRIEFTVFAGSPRPIDLFSLRSLSPNSTEVTLTVDYLPRWMLFPVSSVGRRVAQAEAALVLGLPAAMG